MATHAHTLTLIPIGAFVHIEKRQPKPRHLYRSVSPCTHEGEPQDYGFITLASIRHLQIDLTKQAVYDVLVGIKRIIVGNIGNNEVDCTACVLAGGD